MYDVPWGTGVGDVKAQMAELKRQRFHGAFCLLREMRTPESRTTHHAPFDYAYRHSQSSPALPQPAHR
jgi:hypothetical protein